MRARNTLAPSSSYFADRSDKSSEYKSDSFQSFGVVRKEIPADYGKGGRPVSTDLEVITISVNRGTRRTRHEGSKSFLKGL
jgi:hypothetical protein